VSSHRATSHARKPPWSARVRRLLVIDGVVLVLLAVVAPGVISGGNLPVVSHLACSVHHGIWVTNETISAHADTYQHGPGCYQ
jgi:hypothetical protein